MTTWALAGSTAFLWRPALRYHIDRVAGDEGGATIQGWCLELSGLPLAHLRLSGDRLYAGTYGLERRDVGAVYKRTHNADWSGFTVKVDSSALAAPLALEVQDDSGRWFTVCADIRA